MLFCPGPQDLQELLIASVCCNGECIIAPSALLPQGISKLQPRMFGRLAAIPMKKELDALAQSVFTALSGERLLEQV